MVGESHAHALDVFPPMMAGRARPLLLTTASLLLGACTVVVDRPQAGGRTVYVLGFARVKLPAAGGAKTGPGAYELSGIGLSLGRVLSLGYFKEFEVRLQPGTDSAVVVVRNQAEREHLERVLLQLNQQQLCLTAKDLSSP